MSTDANETMMGDWLGRDPRSPEPVKHPDAKPIEYNFQRPLPDVFDPVKAAIDKSVNDLAWATERYRVGVRITVSSTLDALRVTARPDGTVPYGQIETDFL